MIDLNELSAQEIGRRLRLARETAGIKQDEAAQFIEVSRPTLVSIEQGVRRVRIKELQVLAHHYGTSVNALMRREAVHTDLMPRFRKLMETEDSHTAEAVELFNNLIKADVELENVLGIGERRNYPPEQGISSGDIARLAQEHADELRSFLGLRGPIVDIFSIVQDRLGIRLYQRKLSTKSRVAGLFTYDDTVGACIFLNANHPVQRRTQSAAHELGHFVGTRRNPEVLETDEKFLSREERYANIFGREFLTPALCFSASFNRWRNITATDRLTRRLVILLANEYAISREACVRRLEELGLAKKGTWDWFQDNGGITDNQAKEILGEAAYRTDPAESDANRSLSHRMSLMAHAAWKRGLMSEGQLSELLKVGRLELRKIIDEIELEEEESDEQLKLPR
ncbi:MAG: ImmA/IrrE family metallo-endopeptidase [Candidatus Melainabacteria bacterium]|nr:ImmA/IrrE family metallo-endopeptidase [Candidatus Melainabacteria bacterium]